jgi:hypothetical protein
MSDWEVILEIGAEGGSVTLYGMQTQPSFDFLDGSGMSAPQSPARLHGVPETRSGGDLLLRHGSALRVAKAAELRKADPRLTEQGWLFKMNSHESIDELSSQYDSPVVDSWEAAIGLRSISMAQTLSFEGSSGVFETNLVCCTRSTCKGSRLRVAA